MKILLAGTPQFSVPIFEQIILNYDVVGIVSQPDSKKGRGLKTVNTPVKELALKYNIKLFQPAKIGLIYKELKEIEYDYMLTAAFGQFIPGMILNLPKIASLNIHGSLLPKYRGAAPIQHAIWNGDKETGINLIYMTNKMDAGNILKEKKMTITKKDNSWTIFQKMSRLATENIVKWLKELYANDFTEIIQDEEKVTLAPKLDKKDAELNLDNDFKTLNNKIRAFNPNPGAYLIFNNKRIKVFEISYKKIKHAPFFFIKNGTMYLTKYQKEGKKIVDLTLQILSK